MNTLSKMLYAIGEHVHKLENKDMPTTVKINNGGTGATTAPAARKNLLENEPLPVAEGGTGRTQEYVVRGFTGPLVSKFYYNGQQNILRAGTPLLFTQRGEFEETFFTATASGHIVFKDKSAYSKWFAWPESVEKSVRIDVIVTPVSVSSSLNQLYIRILNKGNPILWKSFYGDEVRGDNSLEASVTTLLENDCDITVECFASNGNVFFDSSDNTDTRNTQLTLTVLN